MSDMDNDTILDQNDNCPTVANTNQRDHDGDGRGDACDLCPHINEAADVDTDMDGVGNACDPRPSTAGDSIALFEGFYDAASIANWTQNGGMWSVANGVLTQSSTTASSNTNALVAPGTYTRAAITAGVRVNALGTPGNGFPPETPHVSVASGIANGQGFWCSVVKEGSNEKLYATIQRPNTQTQFPNVDWAGTFAANSDLRITEQLVGSSTNTCTVVQGATTGTTNGTFNAAPAAGSVQVATRTASASFDYVFVVSVGN